jgi:hypothetical protein
VRSCCTPAHLLSECHGINSHPRPTLEGRSCHTSHFQWHHTRSCHVLTLSEDKFTVSITTTTTTKGFFSKTVSTSTTLTLVKWTASNAVSPPGTLKRQRKKPQPCKRPSSFAIPATRRPRPRPKQHLPYPYHHHQQQQQPGSNCIRSDPFPLFFAAPIQSPSWRKAWHCGTLFARCLIGFYWPSYQRGKILWVAHEVLLLGYVWLDYSHSKQAQQLK